MNLWDFLQQEAARQGVDPALAARVMRTESGGDPSAVSPKGATGPMQLMPATAKGLGVDINDPYDNIRGGVRYLKQQLDTFGAPDLALAAYNAGPGNVRKYGGIPPFAETQNYVRKNMPQSQGFDGASIFGAAPAAKDEQKAFDGASIFGGGDVPAKSEEAAPEQDMAQPAQQSRPVNPWTMGVGDVVRGGVQGLVHGIGAIANAVAPNSQIAKDFATGVPQVDSLVGKQEKDYTAQRKAEGKSGTDWARLGGNVLGSTVALGAMPAGAGSLPAAVGAGMLSGAAGGALQPVTEGNYGREKLGQMAMGAGLGAVAAPIANTIGRVISPNVTPEAAALRKEGITPTIGQALGGTAARTEEKLTSVPFMGDAIKSAQRRAIDDLNVAAYNRALEPIGERFTGTVGTDGVKQVANKLSAAYDDVLNGMTLRVDPQLHADVTGIASALRGAVPESEANTFASIIRSQLGEKLGQNGTMDGAKLKGVQSELQRIASGYAKDPSFDKQQLGRAVGAVKEAIDANLGRVNAPEAAQRLADINRGWANYTRIRQAASSQGAMNQGGVFTAAQLQNAVRGLDKSVGKGNVAKGGALMQDLSGPAQAVLGGKYPDSGTGGRLLLGGLLGGGAVMNPGVAAATAGAGLAASAPYSQLGQRLIGNYLLDQSAGRQAVGQAVRRWSPLIGAPAGVLGVGAIQSR